MPDPAHDLHTLRTMVAALEAPPTLSNPAGEDVLFTLGEALEPHLKRCHLHEVTAVEVGDGPATLSFALALAFRAMAAGRRTRRRPLLLVLDSLCERETGRPYGHGLAALGLDPDRLLLVRTRRPVEALWACEEGLRSGAVGAVVTAFARRPRAYDLTASRRLVLAARAGGVCAVLAVVGEGGAAARLSSAAETRWSIAARPGPTGLAGEPTILSLRAGLVRRRGGEPFTCQLEWSHDTRSFRDAAAGPALPGTVAPLSGDRPDQAA